MVPLTLPDTSHALAAKGRRYALQRSDKFTSPFLNEAIYVLNYRIMQMFLVHVTVLNYRLRILQFALRVKLRLQHGSLKLPCHNIYPMTCSRYLLEFYLFQDSSWLVGKRVFTSMKWLS